MSPRYRNSFQRRNDIGDLTRFPRGDEIETLRFAGRTPWRRAQAISSSSNAKSLGGETEARIVKRKRSRYFGRAAAPNQSLDARDDLIEGGRLGQYSSAPRNMAEVSLLPFSRLCLRHQQVRKLPRPNAAPRRPRGNIDDGQSGGRIAFPQSRCGDFLAEKLAE